MSQMLRYVLVIVVMLYDVATVEWRKVPGKLCACRGQNVTLTWIFHTRTMSQITAINIYEEKGAQKNLILVKYPQKSPDSQGDFHNRITYAETELTEYTKAVNVTLNHVDSLMEWTRYSIYLANLTEEQQENSDCLLNNATDCSLSLKIHTAEHEEVGTKSLNIHTPYTLSAVYWPEWAIRVTLDRVNKTLSMPLVTRSDCHSQCTFDNITFPLGEVIVTLTVEYLLKCSIQVQSVHVVTEHPKISIIPQNGVLPRDNSNTRVVVTVVVGVIAVLVCIVAAIVCYTKHKYQRKNNGPSVHYHSAPELEGNMQ